MFGNALAMAGRASGLRLVIEGPTAELAAVDRSAMDPARYGDRWSPVMVSFNTPERIPQLDGRVAGLGGSQSVTDSFGRSVNETGIVHLDTPDLRDILTLPDGEAEVTAIMAHEIGHVLGRGHVDDAGQLMGARNRGQVTFGDGDRRGLAVLADRPCQFEL